MTIHEYSNCNLPFYHITPKRNVKRILTDGLQPRLFGICVVRTNDDGVINHIASTMLSERGDREFSVIKLLPRKHRINSSMVAPDSAEEPTTPLHNYIVINQPIPITEDDIVNNLFKITSDSTFYKDLAVSLTGYERTSLPNIKI